MKFELIVVLITSAIILTGFLVHDSLQHPCIRYGEPHTTFFLIDDLVVPQETRTCVERKP